MPGSSKRSSGSPGEKGRSPTRSPGRQKRSVKAGSPETLPEILSAMSDEQLMACLSLALDLAAADQMLKAAAGVAPEADSQTEALS